jgi:hypothetical protein
MLYSTKKIHSMLSSVQTAKEPGRKASSRFEITAFQDNCAIGFNASSRNPSLIVVVPRFEALVGRSTEGLVLSSYPDAHFRYKNRKWNSASIAIECRSSTALRTFSVLAAEIFDLASRSALDSQRIVAVFDEWESLFGQVTRMTQNDALGLWGEVWLLSNSEQPDAAISAWIANRVGRTDLLANGVSFEVKTSRLRLTHFISDSQVQRPNGDGDAYFVSIWCEEDDSGMSLPEIVSQLIDRAVDTQMLERKLLARGYSHVHADSYPSRYRVLETPRLFRSVDIPRVREVDDGVSSVRYQVRLKEAAALTPASAGQLLATCLHFDQAQWA